MNEIVEFVSRGLGGFHDLYAQPAFWFATVCFLVIAACYDVQTLKIPNRLNAMFASWNIVWFVLLPLSQGEWREALGATASAGFGFIILLIPAVITGFRMAGDIKLIGAFGFALPFPSMVLFLGVSLLINLATNLALIIGKKKSVAQVLPFAPFFVTAFFIGTILSFV